MRALGKYVSREFHYTVQDLIQVHGWRHVEPSVLSQHAASSKARLLELFGEVPESVLFWKTHDLFNPIASALKSLGCRVDIFADDLYSPLGDESMREASCRPSPTAIAFLLPTDTFSMNFTQSCGIANGRYGYLMRLRRTSFCHSTIGLRTPFCFAGALHRSIRCGHE